MRSTALLLLLIILIIAGAPSSSFGQQPMAILQQGIDQAIRILDDPRFQNADRKKDQQQELWEIMLEFFDFKEFSRKVLGAYWKKFSPQQREEFVKVFGKFLGRFYLGRLQNRYNKERVIYLRQQLIGDSRALVEVQVLWRNLKVPVKLRMTNRSGKWKVYDLSVMGIEAASNYRAQFKSILSRESPQQIIGRLKEKIAELDGKS
jgi:phospholipid transport system substrate-binding protein